MIAGVPAIAIAYLTEEIAPEHAARAAGTFVAGTSIGGLLGRVVAGPITDIATWRVGVFAVAVLCAVAAVGFVKLAPQSRGFTPSNGRSANPEGSLAHRLLVNLRSPRQLTLFAQGFLLMGGFVAIYNYLAFRLTAAPYHLPVTVVSLIFFAYLAGTFAAPTLAGALATRFGRKAVLLTSIAIMITGVLITLCANIFSGIGRSGGSHRRLLRCPRDRHRMGWPRSHRRQGTGLVAVQPVLLRRIEHHRLVRWHRLAAGRLDRRGVNSPHSRRCCGGRRSIVPAPQLSIPLYSSSHAMREPPK